MKKRSKEINIFSMSALDLFASALGAFILITIVLFPFFPNTGDSPERIADVRQEMSQQIDSLEQQVQSLQSQVSQTQQQLQQCQQQQQSLQSQLSEAQSDILSMQQSMESQMQDTLNQLQQCQAQLEQTFALVVISWPSGDDVDLHVTDPRGNEYSYAAETFPGSDAAFEEDNTSGPGNEIWLSPSAIPGSYTIELNMYSKNDSGAVEVRGSVLHKDGREVLPVTTLSSEGQRVLVATVDIDEEGNVTIR